MKSLGAAISKAISVRNYNNFLGEKQDAVNFRIKKVKENTKKGSSETDTMWYLKRCFVKAE